ncbi:uncharacterized protein STEHIDRAFT_76210, partial [Stereum hirsutum FP-91666 SS1]|uniref:uncharacterized protein n=1 Tax=Stereum hirsutum (strain FP-91666) TaxID=721885 RepID=UPI000440CEFC
MEVRWSSTYLMIDRALELYQAIDCFLNKSKQRDISCYNLTSDDLRVLADIRDFLAIPHDVQQLLSNEKTPTLPNVLPAYEELLSMLKDSVDDFPHLSQAIEAAVSKIEEYVGKARKTRAYALAIGK